MLKILQDLATNNQSLHSVALTTIHSDHAELLAFVEETTYPSLQVLYQTASVFILFLVK